MFGLCPMKKIHQILLAKNNEFCCHSEKCECMEKKVDYHAISFASKLSLWLILSSALMGYKFPPLLCKIQPTFGRILLSLWLHLFLDCPLLPAHPSNLLMYLLHNHPHCLLCSPHQILLCYLSCPSFYPLEHLKLCHEQNNKIANDVLDFSISISHCHSWISDFLSIIR